MAVRMMIFSFRLVSGIGAIITAFNLGKFSRRHVFDIKLARSVLNCQRYAICSPGCGSGAARGGVHPRDRAHAPWLILVLRIVKQRRTE